MPSTVPLLVQERPEPDTSWKKFVAVLCFIEFYVEFVQAGHDLWTEALRDLQRVDDPICDIWVNAARIVRAASLYLLGRSLWLGRGRMGVWLVGSILTSLAVISITCYYLFGTDESLYARLSALGAVSLVYCANMLHGHAAWLALLFGGLVVALSKSRGPIREIPTWVVLAVAWTIGVLAVVWLSPAGHDIAEPLAWCFETAGVGPRYTGLIVYGAVLVLLIVGLLSGWRWSRCVALVLAVTAITFAIESAYTIGLLVMIAIQVLYYSANLDAESLIFWPDYFLLNKHAFEALFVSSVAYAGPWLLIAIFAWRVPMRRLPDDGSPWPRRFCPKCYYNLHGLDSGRCPECGADLDWARSLCTSGGILRGGLLR